VRVLSVNELEHVPCYGKEYIPFAVVQKEMASLNYLHDSEKSYS
jgi:hypothetical protein